MEVYVGLDVSLKETSICVVDGSGKIVSEGTVLSEPLVLAEFLRAKAGHAKRIGLETGPTTTWLWHELRALGLPVICIDARHAKAALSLQINKSDRNDAVGLAGLCSAVGTRRSRSRAYRATRCEPSSTAGHSW
jgi:transposase